MGNASTLKNPFIGLRAFEVNEGNLFFGRSSQTNYILKRFKQNHFLAAIGSSGSGKSSLIKSGTIPAIYAGFLESGKNWHVTSFRPCSHPNGNNPINNLAHELAKEGVLYKDIASSEFPYESIIESTLRRSNLGLINVFKEARLPETENLLIVVDQFEELFRYNEEEKERKDAISDATHFVNILLEAARQIEFPIYVLITLRADYLGDCETFNGLPEAINQGQYLVPRMTREEIREAITSPIIIKGATISERLVTRLLNDVGNDNDQLPVLQHAMMRTWEKWIGRARPDLPIDLEDYEETGGMTKALSKHADEAFDELKTDRQREICASIFKSLSSLSADGRRVRRPTSVNVLSKIANAQTNEVIEVVEIFRREGRAFLMPSPEVPLYDSTIIDLTHESLMRIWEKAKKWNDEELEAAELYRDLSEDATLHKTIGKAFWIDPILALGLKWHKDTKPNAVWAKRYNDNFEEAIDFLFKSQKKDRKLKIKIRNRRILQFLAGTAALCYLVFYSTKLYYNNIIVNKNDVIDSLINRPININSDTFDTIEFTDIKTFRVAVNNPKADNDSFNLIVNYNQKTNGSSKTGSFSTTSAYPAYNGQEPVKPVIIHDGNTITNTIIKTEFITKEVNTVTKADAIIKYRTRIESIVISPRNIKRDTTNYKFIINVAYLDSLDTLRNLLLYEKLYVLLLNSDCEFKKRVLSAIPAGTHEVKPGEYKVKISPDKFYLLKGNDKIKSPDNSQFRAISFDAESMYILCSMYSGNVYLYKYSNPDKATFIFTYPKPITALAYDVIDKRIYFGLENGQIGFQNINNKGQDIYKTVFKSKIKALDFLLYKNNKKKNSKYLLAASEKDGAYVYEMSDECNLTYLKQDNELKGVKMPEKVFKIEDAWFAKEDSTVIVKGEKNYIWNPFALSLLYDLSKCLKLKSPTLYEKISTDYKIVIK